MPKVLTRTRLMRPAHDFKDSHLPLLELIWMLTRGRRLFSAVSATVARATLMKSLSGRSARSLAQAVGPRLR